MKHGHHLLVLAVMTFVLLGFVPRSTRAAPAHSHRHAAYIHARYGTEPRVDQRGSQEAAYLTPALKLPATRTTEECAELLGGLDAGAFSQPRQGRAPPHSLLIS